MRAPATVAAGVSACLLVAVAVGCGPGGPTPPPGLDEAQLTGWRAYLDLNCGSCHGADRQGQRSGPPLTGLAGHWTADRLVAYLSDPDATIEASPRLARVAESYGVRMPAVSGKRPGYAAKAGEERLRAIAEYLLVEPP